MSKFNATIKDSFKLFVANPKFIIPKLFMVILYSFLILMTVDISAQALMNPTLDEATKILVDLLLLLGATIVLSLVDVFIGSMYPFMVEQVQKKKELNLKQAAGKAFKKIGLFIPAVIAVEFLFLVVIFLLTIPLSFLIVAEEAYFVFFSIFYVGVVLAMVFFFYLLYPILAFEKVSIIQSLKRSVNVSLKNRGDIAKATIISFLLSGFSFGLAFMIELFPGGDATIFFWVAFIIVRFLTAYMYSYLFVLNPVFYLNYVKVKK